MLCQHFGLCRQIPQLLKALIQAWAFEHEPKPNPAPLVDVTRKKLRQKSWKKTGDDKNVGLASPGGFSSFEMDPFS